jgi:hypothetical protein
MTRVRAAGVATVLLVFLVAPSAAGAALSFAPGKSLVTARNSDGTIARKAGTHPYSYTVSFELSTDAEGRTEGGEMRDVRVTLPPGMIGNPLSVPQCPRQKFEGDRPSCPGSTQVGVLRATVRSLGEIRGPIFNVAPPPGIAAQFGFSSTGFTALQYASVNSEEGYRLSVFSPDLPLEASAVTATFWGTPADHVHDAERFCIAETGAQFEGCSSDAPALPYLTLPASCGGAPETRIEVDSKQEPGAFVKEIVTAVDSGGNPAPMLSCDTVPFAPSIGSRATSPAADSATGLDFQLNLPNKGLLTPGGTAETQPQKTEVTLPAGVAVNPSAANGIQACSLAQYKAATLTDLGCPEASKVGTLLAKTPLLEEAIEGSVYLAAPRDNPFGSFLAIYIIARVPERGVVVKQAGEVHADPLTGQLTTTVGGLPPIPYSSFDLQLREGPRAPLVTPQLCGTYTTTARLYPFSNPTTATERTAPFQITAGAGGGACAPSEASLPAHPALEAGTTSTLAGAFSPFLFKVSRTDGEQRFASLEAKLPNGLTGKLKGVPYCSEAQIATAKAREVEGGGAAELASPSCPPASQVGTVNVAAGAGPAPYYVTGKAYLAGPYKGAPLSLAIITPGVAGPFDLGAVVARAGLYVDKTTAAITVKSDPIPTILQGIPLDVRKIAVATDRSEFTLNPTSCEAMAVSGVMTMTTGATAPLSNRFQVGGCRHLPFRPDLQIRFKGPSERTAHPKVIATLKARPGEASIAFAQVKLPKAAFLDNAHIKTICTRVQFAAGEGNGADCPAGSIYGRAEAKTPLLDYPLKARVYLRSSSHTLPDLVVAFKGPDYQPIELELAGKTDSVKGALRNTFKTAPDAPVSSFRLELFGGKRGLVILSSGLCKHRRATARFRGHNGREYEARPRVKASCGGGERRKPH